jgi:hypothetical protein
LEHALLKAFSKATYKIRYSKAKSTGTCLLCGKHAKVFENESSRFEYNISALCQTCQDQYLNGKSSGR